AYKKIYLIDGNGRVIDSVLTNRRGFFKFRNLDADLEYIASVSEDEADLAGKDYYLVNAQGHVVKVGYPFKKWKYAFRPIPADSFSLQEITPDNDVILAGNLRYGPKGADVLGRVRIYLTNANSVVVDSVVTNEYGCFSFRNLPADQNYMMSMNEADMKLPLNTKVILTDKNGKVVKVFYVGKDRFEYRVMSAEKNLLHDLETDDEDLVMKLNGFVLDHNKKAMGNVTLILFDSTGMQRQIIRTDSSGKFSFKNLKVGLTGHVEIITGDARDSVLFIADSKGRVYKKLRRNAGGKFEYKLLNVDEAAMGDFTVDDPWLKVVQMENKSDTLTIVERIFYATNDFKFDSVGQRVLDKTINVLKANSRLVIELGSHTDSRSNDTYNLKLSNERAQYAVEYIVSKGIDKSRLKAVGYGETRLLNKCSNNVKCSEKEHALNRRTEFRITTSGEATPLKTMK
ncbi:MAG: OmpA family protein, partial [Bacteroidia bacterium]